MSLWHVTLYDPLIAREWTLIAVLPDAKPREQLPFPAGILLAGPSREASALVRSLPLESMLAQQGMAGLCVPGWVLEHPNAREIITRRLHQWFEKMFPVKAVYVAGMEQSAQMLCSMAAQEALPLSINNDILTNA